MDVPKRDGLSIASPALGIVSLVQPNFFLQEAVQEQLDFTGLDH